MDVLVDRVINQQIGVDEHFADSILGQHLSLRSKFSALNHFVTPQKGCSIAEAFHLLLFPMDKSYTRVRVFTLTFMYMNHEYILRKIKKLEVERETHAQTDSSILKRLSSQRTRKTKKLSPPNKKLVKFFQQKRINSLNL